MSRRVCAVKPEHAVKICTEIIGNSTGLAHDMLAPHAQKLISEFDRIGLQIVAREDGAMFPQVSASHQQGG